MQAMQGKPATLQPSSLQVFLPGTHDPAHGVVRTLVRDNDDDPGSPSFLDTDGMLNNFDGVRNNPFFYQVR